MMDTTNAKQKRKRSARAFVSGVSYAFRISHGAAPRPFIKPLSFAAALRTDNAALAGDWDNVATDLRAACGAFAEEIATER